MRLLPSRFKLTKPVRPVRLLSACFVVGVYQEAKKEGGLHVRGRLRGNSEEEALRPHHTAIVEAALGDGRLRTLEQHVKPLGKKVQSPIIYWRSAKIPPWTFPETIRDNADRRTPAMVTEEVEVLVTGSIWAYRPRAK